MGVFRMELPCSFGKSGIFRILSTHCPVSRRGTGNLGDLAMLDFVDWRSTTRKHGIAGETEFAPPRSLVPLLAYGLWLLAVAQTAGAQAPPPLPNAAELLAAAQQRLIGHNQIRADLQEIVSIKEPAFRMTGSYVSAGLKLRLKFTVKLPGNVQGSLLEVCDGERLWSVTELPGATRVTRRDVRQILSALEQAKTHPERAATVDLALGGLPALLTSLTQSMQFQSVKEDTLAEHKVWAVSGKWRSEVVKQLTGGEEEGALPAHIPDAVRVYLAQDTLFPERIVYFKQQGDSGGYRPLLDLRLTNIVLDGPVNPREFEFAPPENVEPEDVTRQFLDQLFPPPSKEAAQPSATESPAKP